MAWKGRARQTEREREREREGGEERGRVKERITAWRNDRKMCGLIYI